MRIILLQEAMVAGPFLLVILFFGLASIFVIYFIVIKVSKLKEEIRELEKSDDEKKLKETRTQYLFLLSIILMLAIAIIMIVVKFFNIKFD